MTEDSVDWSGSPAQEGRLSSRRRAALLVGAICLIWLVLFTLRLIAPSDLMGKDQQRPASYVMDVVVNDHWICQRDDRGGVTSKPPMLTWLSALATVAAGRISLLTFYLPSALAVLLTTLLILGFGARTFGATAGFLGALAYLVSNPGLKQLCLGRTEPVFTLMVMLSWICAYRAAFLGRSWVWFWVGCALATLTKGPLGLVLAAGGLFARPWETRGGHHVRGGRGHVPGILIYLVVVGGWFLLAWNALGQDLIDRMIGRELVGHALTGGKGIVPGERFYLPTLYFLGRFFPASLLTAWGLWRVFRRGESIGRRRRTERFLAMQFLTGLVIFSIAPHQRADLLIPLLPAASLLAGREAARLASRRGWKLARLRTAAIALVLGCIAVVIYYHVSLRKNRRVVNTRNVIEAADGIEKNVGRAFPFTYTLTAPYAFQFHMNTYVQEVSAERAAKLLSRDPAAFVCVSEPAELEALLLARGTTVHELVATRAKDPQPLVILGNRPTLAFETEMATLRGPLAVLTRGVKLIDCSQSPGSTQITIEAAPTEGSITLSNEGDRPERVQMSVAGARPATEPVTRTLPPGGRTTIPTPASTGPPEEPSPLRNAAGIAALLIAVGLLILQFARWATARLAPRT